MGFGVGGLGSRVERLGFRLRIRGLKLLWLRSLGFKGFGSFARLSVERVSISFEGHVASKTPEALVYEAYLGPLQGSSCLMSEPD